MRTRAVGNIGGRKVTSWVVQVTYGETAARTQRYVYPVGFTRVLAPTAAEAADYVQREIKGIPCVEIEIYGPKGGVAARRWQGWDSARYQQMEQAREQARTAEAQQAFWLTKK